MDFITDLPESTGYTNMLVFTDHLSKSVICKPCAGMVAEEVLRSVPYCPIRV